MRPEHECEPPPGWEDPIVAEVHRIRREIMAEFNNDLEACFRYIQALEKENRKRGVKYVSHPLRRPDDCRVGTA
jgi:hypothetical protein